MRRHSTFADCHPAVNTIYFILVLLGSMCWTHPLALLVSLAGGLCCLLCFHGSDGLPRVFALLLPAALTAAVINPAFNHRGVTILTYLPDGNPLTLESILFGLAAAGTLSAVLLWFSCAAAVMTTDKWVWLLGRLFPALGLLLSMALRFIPRLTRQLHQLLQAHPMEEQIGRRRPTASLRRLVGIFSALITWSLESAADTADSMKSRGYGLPGRTAFAPCRLDGRDRLLLVWFGLCALVLGSGWAMGAAESRYYPSLRFAPLTLPAAGFWLLWLLLCMTPAILDLTQARRWHRAIAHQFEEVTG